jgi:alpha-L-rhamnosidase
MPMLRTEFPASGKEIKTARLYVTARGIYEMYLNGKRIGEDYFNPGLTQYNITFMYQTYDVTSLIIPGSKNAIGALLGEGWWSGNITFTGSNWNFFGDRQSLLAKLVITYSDGLSSIITTNDRDWKFYNNGPILYGSFFQGELYDATREASVKGWNTVGYDDTKWVTAVEIPLRGTTYTGISTGFDGTKSNFSLRSAF